MQSEDDFLYESLINRLKKQDSIKTQLNNSEFTSKSNCYLQQVLNSIIKEEEKDEKFDDDSGSSSDANLGLSLQNRLKRRFYNDVKDKAKFFAEEMGIDPELFRLSNVGHNKNQNNQRKDTINVILPS